MAVTGHGATFTFTSNLGSLSGGVTKITVDTGSAEIADVTGLNDPTDAAVLVPTGALKGATIAVDFFRGSATSANISSLIRGYGQLSFSSDGYSVTRQVVLESGSESAEVGDIVRGTMRFVATDYYG